MRAALNRANFLGGLFSLRNVKSMSSSSSQNFVSRSVIKKVFAKLQKEGDGAVVRRGISRFFNHFSSYLRKVNDSQLSLINFLLLHKFRSEQKLLDPFLMLDEFSGTFLICLFISSIKQKQSFIDH